MAKTVTKKKSVTKTKKSDVIPIDNSVFLEDSEIDNHMSKDDIAIPRINTLQALSPAVNKRDAEYVKGAEPGMLADLTQQKLFDGEKGLVVVPVSYRRTYVEWKPRDDGGDFVDDHGIDDELLASATRNDAGGLVLENGNLLVVTAEYIVLVLEDGVASPAVFSLSSSQLKKSKRWNTVITNYQVPHPNGGHFNPAMFYRAYRITTVPENNDKGSWFGVNIVAEDDLVNMKNGKDIYLQARALREQVDSGEVKVTQPTEDNAQSEDDNAPM